MAQPGTNKAKVHPSRRRNNPMAYKSGKPRLRTLNVTQLVALVAKTSIKKEKSKIERELLKRTK
jgi:hypothetical protein